MTWDPAEVNVFSESSGSLFSLHDRMVKGLSSIEFVKKNQIGRIKNIDAGNGPLGSGDMLISSDPPYYDNIAYSDLSDYFYVWLRRTLGWAYPSLFRRIVTPKDQELISSSFRHGGDQAGEAFFADKMSKALANINRASADQPISLYYAFKQGGGAQDETVKAGWSSFLQALVDSELVVEGTWPIRTERSARSGALDVNALASSIVLVCSKRANDAPVVTRADFVRNLKRELPAAIDAIRKAGVGPVDMQQSVIGPGMGVFSRHAKVLEDDDSAMSVKTALALINRVWEEIENELDQAFDAETQVALAWFATYGFDARASGELITLTTAKNTSDRALFASGVFKDMKGKAGLTPREELPTGWSPAGDKSLTVWECVQHTARVLNAPDGGGDAAAALVAQMGPKAEEARALAYRLFEVATNKGWNAEALVYNELAQEWTKLEDVAATIDDAGRVAGSNQTAFTFEGTA